MVKEGKRRSDAETGSSLQDSEVGGGAVEILVCWGKRGPYWKPEIYSKKKKKGEEISFSLGK